MNAPRTWLVRLLCICSAVAVLPLAPVAIATAGTQRRHPIDLNGSRMLTGGAVITRKGEVLEAVRFGGGAWIAASSPEARRRFRNVPIGALVEYRLHDSRVISGRVVAVPADAATIVRRLDLAFLALLFAVAGLALGLGGMNRAATSAGGFLAGLAVTLGFPLLEPNLVHIPPAAVRDGLIIAYVLIPGALWCRYLLLLAAEFPYALRIRSAERAIIEGVSAAAVARAVLLAFSQAGVIFDRLPAAAASAIIRFLETNLLQLVPYALTAVLALALVVRQARALRVRQRTGDLGDRVRIVAWGCGTGIAIPLAGAMTQSASLLATGRLAMPREVMAVLLLPLALVPASLVHALLSRRVERVGILARRAIVFAVADRTLFAVGLSAAAVLIGLFYSHRGEPIGRFARDRAPAVILVGAAILATAVLRRVVQRLFYRHRDSRPLAGSFAMTAGKARDLEALGRALVEHLDDALHIESAALLVHDRGRGMFVDAAGVLLPLDLSSRLVRTAAECGKSFAIDVARLPEAERAWIGQRHFAVATPLVDSRHELLGLLVAGEKMSGLPFDGDDFLLLDTAAASAALAMENLQLRDAPPRSLESAHDVVERALMCETCGMVYDPLLPVRCSGDATPLVPAEIPHIHGQFRFEQRIGRGAMGVVYRARDLVLGREVAIKTLSAPASDATERFEREARAVAALRHSSIATIHAWESWRGRPMLVFELLDGGTLAERIARGSLAPSEVIHIGVAVADALAHAHAAGILHRDVKPSNIGFGRDGAVKLLDFGLVHFRNEPSIGLAGTPLYLSPEAILGATPAPADDVWAAAVTLYEALTGHNPFDAVTTVLAVNAVLDRDVPDPRTLRGDVPAELAELLLRALHRDVARRITTAAALHQTLVGMSFTPLSQSSSSSPGS